MQWNYMNDSFRTEAFMKYTPETIACACIFLAARKLQIPLPESPPWYAIFMVSDREIKDIAVMILKLYKRAKPNADALEQIVNEVKKRHVEEKLKARGMIAEGATPISGSRPGTPSKISPSPVMLPGMHKIKLEDNHSDSSAGYNHRKRDFSHSMSRSRSRSRSRTDSLHSSSRSRSGSRSPAHKRRYLTPPRKSKKDSRKDKYRDIKNSKDRDYSKERNYKDDYGKDRDYKMKDRDYKAKRSSKRHHSRSLSPDNGYARSPERSRSGHSKKYSKEKERYRSRSRSPHDRQHSRKHNGHRSHSRDMYRR